MMKPGIPVFGHYELAEQHRDQLRPATKALSRSFHIVFLYQRPELQAREVRSS